MKNLSFREKYLIFDLAKPAGKPGEGLQVPSQVVAPAAIPEAGDVAAGKVDAEKTTKTKLESIKSGMDLVKFKEAMEKDFQGKFEILIGTLNLNGESIKPVLAGKLDFDDPNFKQQISNLVSAVLANKNFDEAAKILTSISDTEVKPDDAKKVVAAIYANTIAKKAKEDMERNFPEFKPFAEQAAKDGKTYEVPMKVKFVGLTGFDEIKFVTSESFKNDYQSFAEKTGVDKKETKPENVSLDSRAAVLQKCFVGKFLLNRGVEIPEDVTEPDAKQKIVDAHYSDIVKGDSPYYFVVCALGGRNLVADGGAAFKDFYDMLPANIRGILDLILPRIEKSPFGLGKLKADGVAETSDSDSKPVMKDEKEFNKIIAAGGGQNMPKEGVVLKENVNLEETQKLVIDFEKGGEMLVPKGKAIRIDGELIPARDGDLKFPTVTKKKITVTGQIAQKVTFKGPIQFTLEKIES